MKPLYLTSMAAVGLAVGLSTPVGAQVTGDRTIGTDLNAEYTLHSLASYGVHHYQSFVVPPNALTLNTFSYWLIGDPWNEGDFVLLHGVVRVPESDLYHSPDLGVFGLITFRLDLPVIPGETLYFQFWANNGLGDEEQYAWVRTTSDDAYADGSFYYIDRPSDYISTGSDLVFRADFTATPEPISLILIGTGLAGLGAMRRRKRRQ